jgi:serine/threonine protein kinase/S1-C subfamily serine protease
MSSQQETTRVCLACGLETQDEISNCPKDGSLLTSGTDPLVGTTFLEKYHITSVLGRGGMSAVYKAKHLMMDRFVAIKFLRAELVHDNIMLQRFQLESKAVSLLKHPNIIAVFDFGLSPTGVPYLIMDFLEGKTVADLVAEDEYIDPERCVFLFGQICSALAHTHNKGVIHRDIKPSNLIVSIGDDGKELAQVVDFGIAKLLEREASDASKLTASGEVFGSPAYMSPEQCSGSAIDARTDIYALACVIYNCLTGRPPLLGRNAMETVLMHVRDMPRSFGEIRPDLSISPALERVVFKALSKDPDERFATMTEFGSELSKSLLASNNNTTWVIPAQKSLPNQGGTDQFEHTMPVGYSSNTVPPNAVPSSVTANIPSNATASIPSNATSNTPSNSPANVPTSGSSFQTRSLRPDAIEPSLDLGRADPVVSLNTDITANPNAPNPVSSDANEGRGRMNPNSMIVPGSDLFGYESLKPALPDELVKPVSSTNPRQAATPEKVEDIPLVAPAKIVSAQKPQLPAVSPKVTTPAISNSGALHEVTVEKKSSTAAIKRNDAPNRNEDPNRPNNNNNKLIIVIVALLVVLAVVGGLIWWQLPNMTGSTSYTPSEVFKNSSHSIVKLRLLTKALRVEHSKYKLTTKDDDPIYVLVDDNSHPSLYKKGKQVSSVEGYMHIGDALLPVTVRLNGDTPVVTATTPAGKVLVFNKGISLESYKIKSEGSGFFVRPDVLATNYHLLAPPNLGMDGFKGGLATIAESNSDLEIAKQQAVGVDQDHDVVLLYVPGSNAKPLSLAGDFSKLEVGEKVYAIGSPNGVDNSMTSGVISSDKLRGLNPKDQDSPKLYIQHSAKIDQGNDGGPLINANGKVIGVNTAYVGNGAVNLAVAAKFVEDMLAKPDVIERMKALTEKAGTDLHG